VAQKTERTVAKGCGNSMLENKRLDSDTVEEEPSLAKASKRLKQVEDKKRIEAQCDGHLLEDEKGKPHTVTQRPKKWPRMMLNALPLKQPGLLHGEVPATEKTIFLSKKSMDKTFGLRSRTVIRSRNWWLGVPIQCPQICKNQLSSRCTTASLNRVLSGRLF